ncbi:SDR family NAD(P)-dependent oxidoreductase [Tardiphaga sp.]|uniref:SDR family NAD(P)-dependent oxidoreductase n=1 Tax=Tardiphaga sp. TaxID=1926292 RepID=UPI0026264AA3|nr:SDR family NAD(P)-dependent oxidoreductase [Tardiphaga sp.]MDB5619029.1 2,5-dichloro-2,5-cyclohexadiene,4-diol dehydrogenase [Tardiphaga sp.]
MRLANKLVVVTAAASGMGRAGVELFLKEGAKVVAIDVNAEALSKMAADIKADGGSIETIQADLSKPEQMRSSINDAAKLLGGGIDVLWAHAGTPGPAGVEDLDLAAYDLAMALNVTSATLAAGEAIKYMRQRGGGSVIFTSSVSGLVGSMMSPIYSAAKFAVVGLTKSLAQNFAKDNVRVNVVCPGLADTPMKLGFTGRSGVAAEAVANQEKLLASVPVGRLCKAEEVASAVLFLASDDASFITGVALPVDGGFTAR